MSEHSQAMTSLLADIGLNIDFVEVVRPSKGVSPQVFFKVDVCGKAVEGTSLVAKGLDRTFGLDPNEGFAVIEEVERMVNNKAAKLREMCKNKGRSEEKAKVVAEKKAIQKDATEKAKDIALKLFLKMVKTRVSGSVVLVYFRDPETGQLTLFGPNPPFNQAPTMNSFLHVVSETLPCECEEAKQKIAAIGAEAVEGGANKAINWESATAMAMQSIMIGNHAESKLRGAVEVFRWDNRPGFPIPEEDYVICKIDWNRLCDGPTPAFDDFLRRVDYPKQLMAWIWKLYDDQDKEGRQMIWCTSRGNAGVSTFCSAISEPLELVTAALLKSSSTDNFSDAQLYLKRLAIMGDCGDPHYHGTQQIKKITGGDTCVINDKYQKAFTDRVWARVFIHSNKFPEVDTSDNSLNTRLMLFKIQSFPTKESRKDMRVLYREEIWHFLYKCKQVHDELCGDSLLSVPITPQMEQGLLVNCETEVRRPLKYYVDNRLEFVTDAPPISVADIWTGFITYLRDLKVTNSADSRYVRYVQYADVLQRRLEQAGVNRGVDVTLSSDSEGRLLVHGVKIKPTKEDLECEL